MKGIVITANMAVEVRDFSEPLYQTVGAAVGGYIEVVRPLDLPEPFCMIVNEEGRLKGLPYNPIGSFWYGTEAHGHPILGSIVLMKEGMNEDDEQDLLGLDNSDVETLMKEIEAAKASKLPREPKNPPPPAQVYEIPDDMDFGEFLNAMFGPARGRKSAAIR